MHVRKSHIGTWMMGICRAPNRDAVYFNLKLGDAHDENIVHVLLTECMWWVEIALWGRRSIRRNSAQTITAQCGAGHCLCFSMSAQCLSKNHEQLTPWTVSRRSRCKGKTVLREHQLSGWGKVWIHHRWEFSGWPFRYMNTGAIDGYDYSRVRGMGHTCSIVKIQNKYMFLVDRATSLLRRLFLYIF